MEETRQLADILGDMLEKGERIDKVGLELLQSASAEQIALAQERMLSGGVTAEQLYRLWVTHEEVLPLVGEKLRAKLGGGHIVRKVLAEHEMVFCFAADLEDANKYVQELETAGSTNQHIRKLAHVAEHLVASEQHCKREEEVIFPELVLRGYAGILKLLHEQHRRLSGANQDLKKLVWGVDKLDFEQFKRQLQDLARYIVPNLRIHIFIETNVVFPLALAVIDDEGVWERVKDVCDEMGYCGYH